MQADAAVALQQRALGIVMSNNRHCCWTCLKLDCRLAHICRILLQIRARSPGPRKAASRDQALLRLCEAVSVSGVLQVQHRGV